MVKCQTAATIEKTKTTTTTTTTPTNFEEYIQKTLAEKNEQLKIEHEKIFAEITETKTKLHEIAKNRSRGVIRKKYKLQQHLDQLKVRLGEIESKKDIREYEEVITPFVFAYEREKHTQLINTLRSDAKNTDTANNTITNYEQFTKISATGDVLTGADNVLKVFKETVENHAPEVCVRDIEYCPECDAVMVLDNVVAVLICDFCGYWTRHIDATSSSMAYGEEVDFPIFAYLPLNHFNERVTYAQGKETTQIPDTIVTLVMRWLYCEYSCRHVDDITLELTFMSMKDLQLRSYYNQNTKLWSIITGKQPLRMTPEHEEQLRMMFKAVYNIWNDYCPEDRKNFLSYNYCLYKFNELLGYDEFLPYFKLLKGEKKLIKQDEIYKSICEDPRLDWEFIPSIEKRTLADEICEWFRLTNEKYETLLDEYGNKCTFDSAAAASAADEFLYLTENWTNISPADSASEERIQEQQPLFFENPFKFFIVKCFVESLEGETMTDHIRKFLQQRYDYDDDTEVKQFLLKMICCQEVPALSIEETDIYLKSLLSIFSAFEDKIESTA